MAAEAGPREQGEAVAVTADLGSPVPQQQRRGRCGPTPVHVAADAGQDRLGRCLGHGAGQAVEVLDGLHVMERSGSGDCR